MLLNILIVIIITTVILVIFSPKIRLEIQNVLGIKSVNEGFLGIVDTGFNRRGANGGRMILEVVGKEPLNRQPTYSEDPEIGNARRDLSRIPSVLDGGFALPRNYNSYKVPDYRDGFELPVMNAPRASEYYHTPRSDAYHIYYQALHDTLEY